MRTTKPHSLGSINAFIKSTFFVTTKTGRRFYGNFNGTTLDLNHQLTKRKTPIGSLVTTDIYGSNRYHWDGKTLHLSPKLWQVVLVPAPGLTKRQVSQLHTSSVLCETYSEVDAKIIAKLENESRVKSKNPYRLEVRKK